MESYSGDPSSFVEERNKKFLKYSFENNNQMFISSDEQDKGHLLKYTFKNGVVDSGFNKFKIEKFTEDELVLVEYSGNYPTSNSTRIFLKREQSYLDSFPIDSKATFLNGLETVYFESDKIYPKFTHKMANNLDEFLQPYLEGLSEDKEQFAYATFIIDTNGKVSNVKIHHHVNKKFDKELKRAILLTSKKWDAPVINNKKVKVLKEIEIHYIEFPNFEKQSGDLIISPSTLISKEYIADFKLAVKKYYRGEFTTALDKLPKKGKLESQWMNLNYFRSIIHESLNQHDKSEKLRIGLKDSHFDYLLEH